MDIQKDIKHSQSSWFGLSRKVTLYSANGTIIREWEGRFKVESTYSGACFIIDGKEIKISGTYIVEEK
jgi:hypothetical protein